MIYVILSLYCHLLIDVMMDGWIFFVFVFFWCRYLIHAYLVKLTRREKVGGGGVESLGRRG